MRYKRGPKYEKEREGGGDVWGNLRHFNRRRFNLFTHTLRHTNTHTAAHEYYYFGFLLVSSQVIVV